MESFSIENRTFFFTSTYTYNAWAQLLIETRIAVFTGTLLRLFSMYLPQTAPPSPEETLQKRLPRFPDAPFSIEAYFRMCVHTSEPYVIRTSTRINHRPPNTSSEVYALSHSM